MKINLFFLIKIAWYYSIFQLMRSLTDHITDKDARELIDYWEVVYQMKIRKTFKNKSRKLFGE
ncbi:hypothetical protein [Proteiniphilum sp. X52]|uniref:hypothetical protein n=1 Tax=Proteiniphilum sp. X52 TaxID=2382159 RepID=UPI000F09D5B6|nr:hypothetical protein [Proteiniphilum sp. X52]RNC65689.1 hypothetical protein D7D25_05965 [Proteiniphilum sp. X52]